MTERLTQILDLKGRELEDGAILLVEDARYRMRRLPIEGAGRP